MIISHNLNAMNANRQLNIVTGIQADHTEKLSSGYRVNRAADDAAGLSISEKMRRQIRGLRQGIENTLDGISLCQTAEGALNEVHSMLHRLEELSVQAANDTNSGEDRQAIQYEIDQILSEIDRISDISEFNGRKIFSSDTVSGTGAASGVGAIGTNTVYGDIFSVTGGIEGIDFEFSNGGLRILSDTALTIRNIDPNVAATSGITIAENVNANIILAGVNIDLSFSSWAPAIRSNSNGNVTVTIADGTNNFLTAGYGSAALEKNGDASTGTLTVIGNTGSLTATGGYGAAGIGAGYSNHANNITISGGNITAIGGVNAAGIGGGYYGNGSNITISGGKVTATSEMYGAGIGGGWYGSGSDITISGGTVRATGGRYGAGIGGGWNSSGGNRKGSNITISGGTVRATGGAAAAGIGGGLDGNGSDITISGGSVTATGGSEGAGIGGGHKGSGNNITISGGTVRATGGDYGAGIGGGITGSGSNITISGGSVTATGRSGAEDIGGGDGGSSSNITISEGVLGGSQFGSSSGALSVNRWWIQCGANAGEGMYLEIRGIDTVTLGINGMNVTTEGGASRALSTITAAVKMVSAVRSEIGAQQNRLEHTIDNENNYLENLTSSESNIRDADIAKEMLELFKANILAQAGVSMLAQANTSNDAVLMLLR